MCLSPPLILQRRQMVVTCGICIKRYPVMAYHNWDCSDLNRCSHFLLFSKDNQYDYKIMWYLH